MTPINKYKKIIFDKDEIKKGLLKDFNKMPASALSVFLAICAYSKNDKVSEVSIATLASTTGLSISVIFYDLVCLQNKSWIKKLPRSSRNLPTKYMILV